ncbi:MAG: flavodoxin [Desulfovibrionaceae bacterium]|nr:flavodoxin [Desulfovibrionaceae bacterium]
MKRLLLRAALGACCLFLLPVSGISAAGTPDSLVRLEGGIFEMGSPASERQRGADETRRTVRVDAFFIDPLEVTQKDWQAVMGSNPSARRGGGLPVENVSWYDAVRYCNALSRARGLEPAYRVEESADGAGAVVWDRRANGYRLPTEAEWEYAARAGTDTPFSTGRHISSRQANFKASYPYLIEENYVTQKDPEVKPGTFRGRTLDAGELPANAFGLRNMHGNVREWVFDYYGPYDLSATDNPAGPAAGALRVNRGGGYDDFGKHLRSACRPAANPRFGEANLGFRVCRNAVSRDETVSTAAPFTIAMPAAPRALVAYYSYSGNTERAAEMLAGMLGCDLYRIEMLHPYRGSIYETSVEDLERGFRPPLKHPLPDLAKYDVVLLGFPTWWATMPMPVYTFLESGSFAGRIILPFSSYGSAIGDSISDMAKAAPGAYMGRSFGFAYSGRNLKSGLAAWLKEAGLLR